MTTDSWKSTLSLQNICTGCCRLIEGTSEIMMRPTDASVDDCSSFNDAIHWLYTGLRETWHLRSVSLTVGIVSHCDFIRCILVFQSFSFPGSGYQSPKLQIQVPPKMCMYKKLHVANNQWYKEKSDNKVHNYHRFFGN